MCCEEIRTAFDASNDCVKNNVLQAKENGKKFKIQLKKGATDTFCCIHVDECLIKGTNSQKCDYWFRQCREKLAIKDYFVELKGSDVTHGFDQIVETIKQVRMKGNFLKKNVTYGIIVASKVPQATGIQNLKERFKKDYGADLFLKSIEYTLISD